MEILRPVENNLLYSEKFQSDIIGFIPWALHDIPYLGNTVQNRWLKDLKIKEFLQIEMISIKRQILDIYIAIPKMLPTKEEFWTCEDPQNDRSLRSI